MVTEHTKSQENITGAQRKGMADPENDRAGRLLFPSFQSLFQSHPHPLIEARLQKVRRGDVAVCAPCRARATRGTFYKAVELLDLDSTADVTKYKCGNRRCWIGRANTKKDEKETHKVVNRRKMTRKRTRKRASGCWSSAIPGANCCVLCAQSR